MEGVALNCKWSPIIHSPSLADFGDPASLRSLLLASIRLAQKHKSEEQSSLLGSFVRGKGLEPLTPSTSRKCSTN